MAIYELRPDAEHFQWLTMADEADFGFESSLRGEPIGATWVPKRVIPLVEDGAPSGPLSDYPTLGTTPTFSRRAVDVLRSMLEANGELLPLISESGEFYAYNVTNVVDALDEERSELTRFQSSGRVMKINRYEFRPHLLSTQTIFKLPQTPRGRPLVSQVFVDAVHRAGLLGFRFDRLSLDE